MNCTLSPLLTLPSASRPRRQPTRALVAWEEQLIARALACDDGEIRDAAVQLAASWGGDHLQGLLQAHQDSEDWLQGYIRSVLADWSI